MFLSRLRVLSSISTFSTCREQVSAPVSTRAGNDKPVLVSVSVAVAPMMRLLCAASELAASAFLEAVLATRNEPEAAIQAAECCALFENAQATFIHAILPDSL